MIALAAALKRRGHEVKLHIGQLYAPIARRLGVPVVTLDIEDRRQGETDGRRAPPAFWQLWDRMAQAADQSLGHVQEQLRRSRAAGEPDPVLVGGSWAVGARLARDCFGLKAVTVHMSPSCFLSARRPPQFQGLRLSKRLPVAVRRLLWRLIEARWLDPFSTQHLNPVCERWGLPPVKRAIGQWLHSPDAVLGLFPSWLCPEQTDLPPRTELVGFPLSDLAGAKPMSLEVAAFLKAGAPPLVFTTGSSMQRSDTFFAQAIEVCRQTGRRGLLLTRHEEQVPELPRSMLHQAFAPLSQVLPQAAALVSHGGIGSCSQAMLHGVPQLMMPYAYDQFDNAGLFAGLGVGLVLPAKADATQMALALKALLDSPDVASHCREHSARMQKDMSEKPALDRACERIEALSAAA
jgi:UDP:flavonoid glycosyltransferase YjiC (YdhE family)